MTARAAIVVLLPSEGWLFKAIIKSIKGDGQSIGADGLSRKFGLYQPSFL
jgi:hypothetical protein